MDMKAYVYSMVRCGIQRTIQGVYPPRCLLCGGTGKKKEGEAVDICDPCQCRLPENLSACIRCALPLPVELSGHSMVCGRCQKKPPDFDYSVSLFRYEQPVVWLVKQLKFNERLSHARLFGELLAERVTHRLEPENASSHSVPDCILPVPLHNKRFRKRGFNQSIELARSVSKKSGVPLELNLVERVRETESQTGLDADKRRKNLRGAFKLVDTTKYKYVVIIDDVVTTGSTVNELAIVLKKSGVERVDVWSIARAL